MTETQTLYCSFCGKSQHEVFKLIAGPTVFICDECVDLCAGIIGADRKQLKSSRTETAPTAQEIRKILDDNIHEQDSLKRLLSVFLHRHYARMDGASDQPHAAANNIILIGESMGRIEVIQSLIRCVDRPVAVLNAMALSRLDKMHDIAHVACQRLLAASAFHFEFAQTGIVYIDDFDQLCRPANSVDTVGETFQKALSDLMPGTAVTFGEESRDQSEPSDAPTLHTDGISFIFGGSFFHLPALEGHKSWNKGQTRDETPEESNGMSSLPGLTDPGAGALIDFGMLPELVHSISAVVELQPNDLPGPSA